MSLPVCAAVWSAKAGWHKTKDGVRHGRIMSRRSPAPSIHAMFVVNDDCHCRLCLVGSEFSQSP
jgi:hypothetical protein